MEGNSITVYGQSNDESTMGVLECGQSLLTTSPEWGYAAIGGDPSYAPQHIFLDGDWEE